MAVAPRPCARTGRCSGGSTDGALVAWPGDLPGLPRPRGHDADAARGGRGDAAVPHRALRQPVGRRTRVARDARRAVDEARDVVADVLGGASRARSCSPAAAPRPTTWPSLGAVTAPRAAWPCARPSSTTPCSTRSSPLGGRVVAVDGRGVVDLDALGRRARRRPSRVVSVMLANNEVGTIQPLAAVAALVRERAPGARRSTPTPCRRFPWLDVAAVGRAADLVSVSAHKFGGPEGRRRARASARASPSRPRRCRRRPGARAPQRHPQRGRHRGHGRGAAGHRRRRATDDGRRGWQALRDRLRRRARSRPVPGVGRDRWRPRPRTRWPASATSASTGVESEALLFLLDGAGVCASAASACASGAMEPSHVLAAMGVPRDVAVGSLRLSLGWRHHRRRRRPSRSRLVPARSPTPARRAV